MRKILLVLISLFTLHSMVQADNDKPIQVNKLPVEARQFIQSNFKDSKVAYAKMETDLWSKTYKVVFTDGESVEFDSKGHWTEVERLKQAIPAKLIPLKVNLYIKQNYPNETITRIERTKKGCELKLLNGLELTFNNDGLLIEMDH